MRPITALAAPDCRELELHHSGQLSADGDRKPHGVLTVYGNVPGGQATAALSGTGGTAAAIVLNPITLTFPSTTINATSAAQNITISNTSSSPVGLQTTTVSGRTLRSPRIPVGRALGPSTGCTVSIAFTPTASGIRSGTFTITDDAGTQTASLSGIGTSPATDALSPLALTFAAQQLNTASAPQQITLTNSGDVPLTLIAAQITSGDFTVVNACGNSLNAHSSCSLNVAFQPKSVGAITGVLTVSDQYRTQTICAERNRRCAAGRLSFACLDYHFSCYRSWRYRSCADGDADQQWRRSASRAEHRGSQATSLLCPAAIPAAATVAAEYCMHDAGCLYADRRRASYRYAHRHGQRRQLSADSIPHRHRR